MKTFVFFACQSRFSEVGGGGTHQYVLNLSIGHPISTSGKLKAKFLIGFNVSIDSH